MDREPVSYSPLWVKGSWDKTMIKADTLRTMIIQGDQANRWQRNMPQANAGREET